MENKETKVVENVYNDIKDFRFLSNENFIQDLNCIDVYGNNFLFYLNKISNSNTRRDLKVSLLCMLDVILKNTSVICDYNSPVIWLNYALESKKHLKTAELIQWKEGYISDQYSNKFDAIEMLKYIVNDIFLVKKSLNYKKYPADKVWLPYYNNIDKFCGNEIIGEIWLENMSIYAFRSLKIKFNSALNKKNLDKFEQIKSMSMSKNSYITFDLIILALKLAIENNIDVTSKESSIVFDNYNKDNDDILLFYDEEKELIVKTTIGELVRKIRFYDLKEVNDRLNFLNKEFDLLLSKGDIISK